MAQWTEYVISTAELIVSNRHDDREFYREFNDVCNYSRGLSYNILGKDRMDTNPDYKFYFNIDKWVSSSEKLPLNGFVYSKPQIQKFVLSEEQFQLVEDELSIYGDSPVGKGQSLKRIPIHKLWRHPENTSIIPQK